MPDKNYVADTQIILKRLKEDKPLTYDEAGTLANNLKRIIERADHAQLQEIKTMINRDRSVLTKFDAFDTDEEKNKYGNSSDEILSMVD